MGHLTRTLAIADRLGDMASSMRILSSSRLSALAMASSRHTIDYFEEDKLLSRENYYRSLSDYIDAHRFRLMILDTFPFGIVGEWLTLARDVPKLLIARSLRWDRYRDVINMNKNETWGQYPLRSLVIEPLAADYEAALKEHGEAAYLKEPILQDRIDQHENAGSTDLVNRCAVIHSGDETECDSLLDYAGKLFKEINISVPIDTIFPGQKIYPAHVLLSSYAYIVSGAGYNMAALASQAGSPRRHYLFPFPRKFDDQHARKKHVESGLWKNMTPDGAGNAARWIMECVNL